MSLSNEKRKKRKIAKSALQTICVLGGSHPGNDATFMVMANGLGRIMAARRIKLVYGGGNQGLRASVASAALLGGSKVTGITLKYLAGQKPNDITLGTELRASNVYERMSNMLDLADAFIAVPGGFETLGELFTLISWAKTGIHQKPIGLLNINGFFDGLIAFLAYVAGQGFTTRTGRPVMGASSNIIQLIDYLTAKISTPTLTVTPVELREACLKGEGEGEPDTNLRL